MSKTNTGSNSNEYYYAIQRLHYLGLMDTHTSSLGSTGKLRFHLVGRLEKRVNSEGSILVVSITTHYPGFQITCYAAYFASRPWYLTNCITVRNPHKGIQ
jgi:hypothetical protein